MLKKLLKGCLTVAMVGAFAASVSADTSFTWSGNAQGVFKQSTSKEATTDAKSVSSMSMYGDADLDLVVEKTGGDWTGTAYLDFDLDAAAVSVDDVYAKMSNDSMAISFGSFDPVGIGKGCDYLNPADTSYGAGGLGLDIPNEQGWLMFSLSDVGLDAFIGLGSGSYSSAADDSDYAESDTSSDGAFDTTSFGAKFAKNLGIVDLAVEYVAYSTARDENKGGAVAKKSRYDGASASELALAVQYAMDKMAFTLNYTSAAFKSGQEGAKTLTQTWTEFMFDMALSDTMGLSASYGMVTDKYDEYEKNGSDINAGVKITTGGVDHFIGYSSNTNKVKDADESATSSILGYAMKVGF